ncbi:MAG: tripartite tricarboxylate transporter substrate binding protein, partial [Devosia sp.]|nr:tripartite tricarboxylate transporter substrate binding protein [Devosia sp.]
MSVKKYASTCFSVLALSLLGSAPTMAQFPEKPVEMTVLFGGSAQAIGQVLADLMSKQLGKPVVAISRPGGGGAIGYSYVNGTAPDGYNIVWNSNSISTVHYQGNLPFGHEAFEPIARIGMEVPVVAVRNDSGWATLADMVEKAKAEGRPLKVGISGIGSFTHLTSAELFAKSGLEVVYIPYGEGRAPAELLAGRIDVAVQWASQFTPHVKSGDVKLLCVTSAEPAPETPDVPTCASTGAEGVNSVMWRGLAAPAGTPPEVVAKLEAAAQAATASPEFQEAAESLGFTPAFLPASEFGELV